MTNVNQRVLVIGATQGTGYQIVNLLLRDGYQVRTLARNEAKAKEKLSSAVEISVGDITKLNTLSSAMKDNLLLAQCSSTSLRETH